MMLSSGVLNSGRVARNRADLEALLARALVLPFDADAAFEYGIVSKQLQDRGKQISQVDRQVASIARLRSLTTLTADRHFDFIHGIAADNRLS